jgi:hypothetical protein
MMPIAMEKAGVIFPKASVLVISEKIYSACVFIVVS